MSDESVGKIELELELSKMNEKQVEDMAANIGKQIGSSIGDIDGNKISAAINGALNSVRKNINNMLGSIKQEIKKDIDELANYASKAMAGVTSGVKKIKVPHVFNRDRSEAPESKATVGTKQSRGPPTGTNFEVLKSQVDNLAQSLDITNAKIEQQKEKLAQLKISYERAFSPEKKNKLMEEILKTEDSINRLTAKSDKNGFKLAELDEQFEGIGSSAKKSSAGVNAVNEKIRDTAKASVKASNGLKGFGNLFRHTHLFSNALGNLGHRARNTGDSFSHMGDVISSSFRRVAKQVLFIGVIYKALRGLISYTTAALMTNQQFVQSLNIIRTNLMVAFQPIYEFVLPALNALMQGIATVTTYIASAISGLFGKTYQQSFQAAKGLNATKAAMAGAGKATTGTGKAAKKAGRAMKKAGEEAKGALAPFDEINKLDMGKDNVPDTPDIDPGIGGGGGGGLDMPPMVMPPMVDVSGFKDIMSKIFEPFKLAWENEGQATIDAMKYALKEVKGLIKEIGKSWLEVWTNGTGQAILETILRILQNIFNTVGDIAQSFTRAWIEGGRGTAIMQHLHNIILHILTLVERLTGAFREVWGEVGDQLARMFLETLKNILATLDHLGEKLVWVWDNGGEHLFKGFVKLGVKIAELGLFILNEFVLPFANWFIDFMAPPVAKLCDWIGKLLDVFCNLIDWLMGDGKPVLEIIVVVLGSMAAAFKLVEGYIKIYMDVSILASNVTRGFGAAVKWLTSPFGIAVVAIGGAIAIGVALYKNWDKIKEKAHEMGENVKKKWQGLKTATHEKFTAMGDTVKDRFNKMKTNSNQNAELMRANIAGAWGNINSKTRETFGNMASNVKNKFNEMKTNASNRASAMKSSIASNWDSMKSKTSGTFGNMLSTVGSKMSAMKNKIVNSGIGRAWDRIWNLKIPHIKLPHFRVSGSFGLKPPSVPHFGVNWYAKGGVFDGPQVIGVGEQGKEAVMPLEHNTGWIDNLAGKLNSKGQDSDETVKLLKMIVDILEGLGMDVNVDGDKLARISIREINKLQRQAGKTLLQV